MHDRDDVGDLRTNAMSCSTTTSVLVVFSSLKIATVLLDLGLGHAGDRLVEQKQPRILHQHHADLEPLRFAVRQDPASMFSVRKGR